MVLSLILYLVIETSQEQYIALKSRSAHGRNSLLRMEDGSEGLAVCNEPKSPPTEIHMGPFHPRPHTMDNASLSIGTYLRSVLFNARETKATDLSLPSGMTCERIAPMLVGEVSHASLTGNAGS